MSEQQTSEKEATIRFTVDMPESMHQQLSLLATQKRQKKAVLVRMVI